MSVAPSLRQLGWVLVGICAALATIYGLVRLNIELGYSPLHYVVEDALFLLVGVLGIVAAVARFRRASADAAAEKAAIAAAASLARLPLGVTRFEARMRPMLFFAVALMALLVLAMGVVLTLAAWSRPSPGPVSWALLTVATGAGLLWLALRQAPWGPPSLLLDAGGLSHRLRGSVRWRDVTGLRLDWVVVPRGGPTPILVLGLAPEAAARRKAGWLFSESHGVLKIALKGLDQLPERIEAAALQLRDRVQPPRSPVWHESMTPAMLGSMQESNRILAEMERLEKAGGFSTESGQAEFARLSEQAAANSQLLLAESKQLNARMRTRLRITIALFVVAMGAGLASIALRVMR